MAEKRTSEADAKCRLLEIVQYSCEHEKVDGRVRTHCFPFPRLFRMCAGRPAVEVTRYARVDAQTGEIEVVVVVD